MTDITFVSPRYGADILGGAEQAVLSLARRFSADGLSVAVLTSRARSYTTWADDYPEGTTVEDGVVVSRFGVDQQRPVDFDALSDQILPHASEASVPQGLAWIERQGPTSTALLDAIATVSSGVLALTPYLYHPTVHGARLSKVPTILHAAAHPELPLELRVFDRVFGSVSALAHYSRAEQELVLSRFPATLTTPQVVLGLPVEPPQYEIDPRAVRANLELGVEPIILCLGRVSRGKGTHELLEMFLAASTLRGGAKLVFAGPLVDEIPKHEDVFCLGPVSDETKYGLLAAADVLVNPSPLESFSLVVLEAWSMGTPVVINGRCGPTREHCESSGGGLWYSGLAEFETAIRRLITDTDLRLRLGTAGQAYVRNRYSWPMVRRRYEALLEQVC